MNLISIFSLIILALIGNFVAFWIKIDLRNEGFETKFFSGHFTDIQNALTVIKTTEEKSTKRAYKQALTSLIVVLILMPIIFLSNLIFRDHRCERFHDYLNHQVIGTIDSKFIDRPNHALETLSLMNGNEENEVTIFINGLYEFLQPGDSISKISGNSELRVYRNDNERTFDVDRTFWCNE